MESKIKRSIILFALISILSGWLGVLTNNILPKQPEGNSLGMLVWLVLPLLSAVLIRVFAKDGAKSLGLKPNFKGNLKWYLVSFFIFPAIILVVLAIGTVSNCIDFSKLNFADFAAAFFGIFAANIIKNIFEELAWRGFLTERLIKLKCNDIKIYITAAAVWLLWHVPYYLFLLPGNMINGSRTSALFSSAIILPCWIIMFTELYGLTRSIWPCVILHASVNSLGVIYNYISISTGKGIFVNYDSGIISLAICVLIGMLLRRYRIKKEGY